VTLVLPARKGSENLAFSFERTQMLLESSQGLRDALLSPGATLGWLRWTCGFLHYRSPAQRFTGNALMLGEAMICRTAMIASFLSYSGQWVKFGIFD
jgi:hypothetical protein